jgi:RHS repeat-associated protein
VPPRLTFADKVVEPRLLHTVRFTYDAQGQIVTETSTDHVRGETHTLRHDHDVLGNRVRTDLPDLPGRATRSLHYLHYGSGHLHQVRLGLGQTEDGTPAAWQIVADFERDDLHREILRTQGKLSTRQFLDPLGRRLGAWTRPGAGLGMLSDDTTGFNNAQAQGASLLEGVTKAYRYDLTGELRESRHAFKGSTRFDYDPTGRIQTVARQNRAGQSQAEHFAYDPSGNLLDAQTPVGRGYVRDNRIRVFEDKRFAYDGLGRLIEKRSGKHMRQTFLWDYEDRLVEVTTFRQPGTEQETRQSVRFEYDAIGRRVAKSDAFGMTRFIWEGMRLIEERRGAHATAYLYEPGSYVPLARVDTSAAPGEAAENDASPPSSEQAEVLYFHTDPSGMPEELSDSRGHIRWRAAYKTWGNTQLESWEAVGLDGRPAEFQRSEVRPANEALPIEQNLRFQGQYLDRDTGLHYNTFRYYDPDIGRFISPDPIGLNGGANLYSYAPNPVSWIDPWGWAQIPCGPAGASTPHTQATGGNKTAAAPKTGLPNSIHEQTRPNGSRSVTYYDEKGRIFSREDYGQQRTHGQLGLGPDGKSVPHEHRVHWSDQGPIGKSYRQLDNNGKPVGPWINE